PARHRRLRPRSPRLDLVSDRAQAAATVAPTCAPLLGPAHPWGHLVPRDFLAGTPGRPRRVSPQSPHRARGRSPHAALTVPRGDFFYRAADIGCGMCSRTVARSGTTPALPRFAMLESIEEGGIMTGRFRSILRLAGAMLA